MKKRINKRIINVLLGLVIGFNVYAQNNQKLAQTSFQFLSVVTDARGAAMADALTSLEAGSSSLFFNPAGMARMENSIDISVSNAQWIADIQHLTFSLAVNPYHGNYGVLGISFRYVDYGDFIGTITRKDLEKGYLETGIFSPHAMAIGLGYAKKLTDMFSVGGQIHWASQDLGASVIPNTYASKPVYDSAGTTILYYADSAVTTSNKLNPLVFDFGTQFRTGFKSLVFGMSVRNFSGETKYAFENFQLPLVFTLGISMDLLDVMGKGEFDQSLYMSIDASHYRDHPEQMKIGLEYQVVKMFTARCGYASNADDRSGWSFGVGFSKFGFAFDYAYTPFGVFDKVQRMTARFSY
jgi:hypothetical protein